jgi:ornithine decarboxylase
MQRPLGGRAIQRFNTGQDAALGLRPDVPVYCFRPDVLRADLRAFTDAFPGKTAYAVKTNGEHFVLKTLAEAGLKAFDVASPGEFAGARAVSADAELLYMHPVKAQSDIRLALEQYAIRVLALDHEDEIAKILRVVRALDLDPGEITLFVRLQTKGAAAYELSKKFGAAPAHAVEFLERIDRIGFRCGIAFHVGSQIQDAEVYERALASADWVRNRAGVPLAGLDIGGGFPAPYGHDPRRKKPELPAIGELMADLRRDLQEWGFTDLPLIAEPGRVVVARSISLIVRVLLKKGRRLYINDGSGRRCPIRGRARSRCRRASSPIRPASGAAATRPNWCRSKSAARRAIRSTSCRARSGCRKPWIPATGSRSAISAPTVLALRTRFNGFYPDTVVEVATPFEDEKGPEAFAAIETMAD